MLFDFQIKEEKDFILIKLKGELIDKNQANPLIEKTDEYLQSNTCNFLIDMGELKYMNSSGLNTIIQILTKARNNNGDAVLFNLNKKINELILITKLHSIFKIAQTHNEAVKLLKAK